MKGLIVRRRFLHQSFLSVVLIRGIGSCLSEEKKQSETTDACVDEQDLSTEELAKRKSLGYVNQSPTENKYCGNCNLWLPPQKEITCGRCQLFKGSVPSEAYCTYWAPQV